MVTANSFAMLPPHFRRLSLRHQAHAWKPPSSWRRLPDCGLL